MVTCWEGSLVYDVFLCFRHFLIWCPASGVVFEKLLVFLLSVFRVILSCLFLAALWSPAGNGLTSLALLYVMFSCVSSLSIWCSKSCVVFDCMDS